MKPVPFQIEKVYPPRGPLQQYRLVQSAAFNCFRCGQSKKSKLTTIYGDDWSRRLCNGCYGRLLSIYEVKGGRTPDDERTDALAAVLLGLVSKDEIIQAERLLRASENRAELLSPEAIRFIATSEHVSKHLASQPGLEWSPAVIGLCKSVELEAARLLLRPLAVQLAEANLAVDRADKDYGRVAAFCTDPTRRPPELGAIVHFLRTLANSKKRRQQSLLLQGFLKLVSNWPGSHWLLDESGLASFLNVLTTDYRNPAAHTTELGQADYARCRNLVLGADGGLWKLLVSTVRHRR
ncbi:hypothetical protein BJ123_12839 [Rhodopseudomonas thermotolerans]|uniref:Uncharacterized protein n=2 Tax=Rhodopseudomonas TaxID=1073 RepID=A0A336JTZ6_9BRAD|nr:MULTISPECIES: hypothetical protein [Rhodopseudomonas]RED26088.1 hypothetical protein BJ125_12839 [Rhodopseudomonas pentothenatexigens]REF91049.1 hypothetical protein BJ123_12839 [Rhodopseudomonas thermotolerans]SSW93012.1 hypothetical protein SAMN05892882_12839 [Rhodopseudomonas pentothenatexigens]